MELEIHGLTGFLFLDIIFIWGFVSMIFLLVIMTLTSLFTEYGLLTINDKNIIKKIIKLKNTDKDLYNFANKLDKDNINFLLRYKLIKLDRLVCSSNLNQVIKKSFKNENEKKLYKKIESIIYYYDLINEK